eukprot:gene68239-93497_t
MRCVRRSVLAGPIAQPDQAIARRAFRSPGSGSSTVAARCPAARIRSRAASSVAYAFSDEVAQRGCLTNDAMAVAIAGLIGSVA